MLNRYVCNAIDEMRSAIREIEKGLDTIPMEGLHFLEVGIRHLSSLIEEVQTSVNRMENALQMRPTVEREERRHKELKAEIKKLKEEKAAIGNSPEPLSTFDKLMEDE